MPRVRFIIPAMFAVAALLATGCGGDDTSEESEGLPAVSAVIAEATDRSETAKRETTEQTDQTEADAEPEPELQPEPEPMPVRLGDRFEWCADVQADFDEMAEHQAAMAAAEVALQDAQAAHDAVTDELDQIEARQARDAAVERLDSLTRERGRSARRAAQWLRGKGLWDPANETRYVAFERALTAYNEAADPDSVALLWASIDLEFDYPPPLPLPGTAPQFAFAVGLRGLVDRVVTPEDALAGIDAYVAEMVPVAEDAAKVVTDSWHAFQQAETTGEMLAAHTTLNEAHATISKVRFALSEAREATDIILSLGRRNDRRPLADVYDAARAAFFAVDDAGGTPSVDFSAMEDHINALALADPAGTNALWASLADSCSL